MALEVCQLIGDVVFEQLQLIGNLDEPIAPENFVVSAPYVDVQQNGLPGGASQ